MGYFYMCVFFQAMIAYLHKRICWKIFDLNYTLIFYWILQTFWDDCKHDFYRRLRVIQACCFLKANGDKLYNNSHHYFLIVVLLVMQIFFYWKVMVFCTIFNHQKNYSIIPFSIMFWNVSFFDLFYIIFKEK